VRKDEVLVSPAGIDAWILYAKHALIGYSLRLTSYRYQDSEPKLSQCKMMNMVYELYV
jgi:hypothetical protein